MNRREMARLQAGQVVEIMDGLTTVGHGLLMVDGVTELRVRAWRSLDGVETIPVARVRLLGSGLTRMSHRTPIYMAPSEVDGLASRASMIAVGEGRRKAHDDQGLMLGARAVGLVAADSLAEWEADQQAADDEAAAIAALRREREAVIERLAGTVPGLRPGGRVVDVVDLARWWNKLPEEDRAAVDVRVSFVPLDREDARRKLSAGA